MELIFKFVFLPVFTPKVSLLFSFLLILFTFLFSVFSFSTLCPFLNVSSDQQSTALPPLLVRLFYNPAMIPLCRDPVWGGLSLVPRIHFYFYFSVSIVDFCFAGVRKTQEDTLKVFIS